MKSIAYCRRRMSVEWWYQCRFSAPVCLVDLDSPARDVRTPVLSCVARSQRYLWPSLWPRLFPPPPPSCMTIHLSHFALPGPLAPPLVLKNRVRCTFTGPGFTGSIFTSTYPLFVFPFTACFLLSSHPPSSFSCIASVRYITSARACSLVVS